MQQGGVWFVVRSKHEGVSVLGAKRRRGGVGWWEVGVTCFGWGQTWLNK